MGSMDGEMEISTLLIITNVFLANTQADKNFVEKFFSKIRNGIHHHSHEDSHEVSDTKDDDLIRSVQKPKRFLPLGCPNGQTFCENPEGYPSSRYLQKLARNLSSMEKLILFSNNARENVMKENEESLEFVVPTRNSIKNVHAKPAVIQTEDIGWVEESPVCDSRISYVYPKAALNHNKEWRHIFSLGNSSRTDYVQVVRVETCIGEGESCRINSPGINTVCRQKFVQHRLLALNQDGDKYIDSFNFPSCCVCHKIGT